MNNLKLTTPIADDLLQRLRDYLDQEADLFAGGSDPTQTYEANRPLVLLRELDRATNGELLVRRRSSNDA
jgi:hypothetical protein